MNGAAVALALDTPASALEPFMQPGIEQAIGEATAAAATALCKALDEFQDGGLTAATKAAGGERIARLFELQQSTAGTLDFAATVQREGARCLRQYFDADYYRRHGVDAGEGLIGILLEEVLAIVAEVTAVERAMAH